MTHVRTTDGVDVDWPWGETDLRTISLDKVRLESLLSKSAVCRILAHRDLLDFQINKLFASKSSNKRARRMRVIAKRIEAHGLEELCAGIGEQKICDIFYSSQDPVVLRTRLMGCWYTEKKWKEDLKALEERKIQMATLPLWNKT